MKSFYHFLMRYRQGKNIDAITKFANDAFRDHSFPKQSKDYDEISRYLEMNGEYLDGMSVFDETWERYMEHEVKA